MSSAARRTSQKTHAESGKLRPLFGLRGWPMSKQWNVAVVGATGLVGTTMISILEQRKFPVARLFPLASSKSAGKSVRFNGKDWPVQDLATFDFSQAQIGLFSAGGSVSAEFAPK